MKSSCTLKDAVSPWMTASYPGIKRYLKFGTEKVFPKGAIIISPGVRCNDLFYIVSGNMKISLVNYQGEEKLVSIIGTGGIIYEGFPTGDNSSSIFVTTMGNCHLVKLTEHQLTSLLEKDPLVASDIIKYLHLKYKMLLSLYQGLLFYSPPQRLCRLFCLLSDTFGEKQEDKLMVYLRLTQTQLAELLGLSRVTVANILKDMRQKNILETKNKTFIFSNKLCDYCQNI
ncbi:MAG: Crp/Fnr family transcriptional regulator [Clostridia bacterium]|nr:Crp/Fnr family transcriptional regulator [Clostridia bacterium]